MLATSTHPQSMHRLQTEDRQHHNLRLLPEGREAFLGSLSCLGAMAKLCIQPLPSNGKQLLPCKCPALWNRCLPHVLKATHTWGERIQCIFSALRQVVDPAALRSQAAAVHLMAMRPKLTDQAGDYHKTETRAYTKKDTRLPGMMAMLSSSKSMSERWT